MYCPIDTGPDCEVHTSSALSPAKVTFEFMLSSTSDPTGVPLVYELDSKMKPVKSGYLGDPEAGVQQVTSTLLLASLMRSASAFSLKPP